MFGLSLPGEPEVRSAAPADHHRAAGCAVSSPAWPREHARLGDTRLRQDESATLDFAGAMPPGTVAVVGTVFVRPDAYHVDSLASHLRATRSAASRRLYEEALAEMTNSGYLLFSEARRVAR